MIRRLLAAAGVVAIVSGVAASPAWAAQGGRAAAGQTRREAAQGLLPRSGEWWFTSWKILQAAWPATEGAGVTVAVLDTGVQASVPDLRGVVLPGTDLTGRHTNGETDGNGHGTEMSVLIAGQGYGTGVVGVAPKARILPVVVNAAPASLTADPATMAAGITYAANHGARVIDIPQEQPSVSATGCDPAVQAAVAYALARNVVVVAAAGDTNLIGTTPSQPASCAGVLAVVAVQPNRSLWPQDTRQPYITVANPGADLITSGRNGQLVTGVSGTSAASALAAGAVALIRSRYPAMPWYQVIQRVTGTALAAGGHVPNDSFGYGLFRLSEAVNAAAYPVPASAPNPVYARYRAWQATPQGQSVSRQLSASTAGKGKSGRANNVIRVATLALAIAAAFAVVLLARSKRRPVHRKPGWHGLRKEQTGTTFLASESGLEFFPNSDPAYTDLGDGYRQLGEEHPYRIPPYMPAPDPGVYPPYRGYPPQRGSLVTPDENNP
jgi:Subtilase family